MGSDIHLYFEYLNKNAEWEKLDVPEYLSPDDRNYHLFGVLADVRNMDNIKPEFAYRTIPDDTSFNHQHQQELGMDHSITYATLEELLNVDWEKYELKDDYFVIFMQEVLPRFFSMFSPFKMYKLFFSPKNVRIIIGFDS